MKLLYLLRHAKAERDALSGEDFDRALAPRGRSDAAALGDSLASGGKLPDLILTSPSQRTLETVKYLTEGWPTAPRIETVQALYLAPAARILDNVRAQGSAAQRVMVVAHNPGIEELALQLAHNIASEPLQRLQKKVPTCALATFDAAIDNWARLAADLCHLTAYSTPKNLADGADA